MKKIFNIILIALFLCTFGINGSSYAESSKVKNSEVIVKYKNSEIKDLNILFERAKMVSPIYQMLGCRKSLC